LDWGFGIDRTVYVDTAKKRKWWGWNREKQRNVNNVISNNSDVIFEIQILPSTERHDSLSYYINYIVYFIQTVML
jgi:hypothetical protein